MNNKLLLLVNPNRKLCRDRKSKLCVALENEDKMNPINFLVVFFAACMVFFCGVVGYHPASAQIPPKWHDCIQKGVTMAYGGGTEVGLTPLGGLVGATQSTSIHDIANKAVNGSISYVEHCIMGNQTK
jgi:hypothetical protein